MESNVSKNLKELFVAMQEFLAKKTVVGEPITIGNIIIVPLLDISFGIGGGSEQKKDQKEAVGGGMGGSITPNSLLILKDGQPQIVNIKNQENVGKVIDMIPGIISQLGLDKMVKKEDKE